MGLYGTVILEECYPISHSTEIRFL